MPALPPLLGGGNQWQFVPDWYGKPELCEQIVHGKRWSMLTEEEKEKIEEFEHAAEELFKAREEAQERMEEEVREASGLDIEAIP